MLTKIGIRGFKSIHDLQDLELGQVNVFIGANGSGKSNLLEAVGMLGAAAAGRVDAKHLLERGVRHGGPGLYKTSLKKEKYQTLTLEARGRWNDVSTKYLINLDNPLKNPTDTWQHLREQLWQDDRKILERRLTNISFTDTDPYPFSDMEDNSGMFNYLARSGFRNAVTDFYNVLKAYIIFAPTTPVLRRQHFPSVPADADSARFSEPPDPLLMICSQLRPVRRACSQAHSG